MTCWGREGKHFLGVPSSKVHQGKAHQRRSTSKEKHIKGKVHQGKIHQRKNGEKVSRGKIYGRKERLYRKM